MNERVQRGLRIVSGGQTGADRAALEWAIARRIPHGGWCPQGRKAEDGPIDDRYQLQETPSAEYQQRTEWNVRDSDGTVILTVADRLMGGSAETARAARVHSKPCLHLSAESHAGRAAALLQQFVLENRIKTLNVAGPRASTEPDVAAFVTTTLNEAFGWVETT